MTKKKEEIPLDPIPDPKPKQVKPAGFRTKANEVEYEVHADGVQVRVRILSYDNTTEQATAKALILVEEAYKRKKKEVVGRDVA